MSRAGISPTKRDSGFAERALYSIRVRAWLKNSRFFARVMPTYASRRSSSS